MFADFDGCFFAAIPQTFEIEEVLPAGIDASGFDVDSLDDCGFVGEVRILLMEFVDEVFVAG